MLILICGQDDNDNALYVDGNLIYYGGEDYLGSETIRNIVGLGLIDFHYMANGARWVAFNDDQCERVYEEHNGYPPTLAEVYVQVPEVELHFQEFTPVNRLT